MNINLDDWKDVEDLTNKIPLDQDLKKDLIELLILEELENEEGNIG